MERLARFAISSRAWAALQYSPSQSGGRRRRAPGTMGHISHTGCHGKARIYTMVVMSYSPLLRFHA